MGGAVRLRNDFKASVLKGIRRLKKADLLVGISTKNVETTIIHVMNVAATGLVDFFPDYRGAVVVCDGYSTDRTMELAQLFELPFKVGKVVTEELGELGKGSSVRTIFEIALRSKAECVVLLDGDLLSVKPEWIEHLGKPPLYGMADLVVPFYIRHKYDGLITNNLAYPLLRALFGVDVRQPIGGEYGLSIELVKRLLEHPLFPTGFGIDIFITTVAAAEGLALQETLLGLKLHTSTLQYSDPRKLLLPMFSEVVGTLLDLMIYYEEVWKAKPRRREVSRVMAKYRGLRPPPTVLSIERMIRLFRQEYEECRGVIRSHLEKGLFEKLAKGINEKVVIDADLWSKSVYSLAAAYKREEQKLPIINALRTLWLGRFITYAEETKDLGVQETERVLEDQARTFEENRDYLISLF